MRYLTLCAIVKDEAPFLKEWVEFHRLLGVEHVHLFDNESASPVAEALAEQVAAGYVTVDLLPGRGRQMEAYTRYADTHRGDTVWLAALDADEFLVPHRESDLRELLSAYEPFGGLSVNWQVFGTSGHARRPEESQTVAFTRKLPPDHPMNRHVKSVVRTAAVRWWVDPHRPVLADGVFCVNECGEGVPGPFAAPAVELVQVNHYFTRAAEDWVRKVARGRADAPDGASDRDLAWVAQIDAEATTTDISAARFATALARAVARPAGPVVFPADVAGWMSEDEGRELARLATGRRVLEIGAYAGRSTICLAQTAASVLAIDPFDGRSTPDPRPTLADFRTNLRAYGVTADHLVGTSAERGSALAARAFDLVFIDADHAEPTVEADIALARRVLAKGGIVCGYDYYDDPRCWPGVKRAVDRLVLRTAGRLRRVGSLWSVRWPVPLEQV